VVIVVIVVLKSHVVFILNTSNRTPAWQQDVTSDTAMLQILAVKQLNGVTKSNVKL
jgi:hypothetical protein